MDRCSVPGAQAPPPASALAPRLLELRSYRAQPGRRDELIGMFEDIFLDAYEAVGARVLGSFRSLDDPDRWVWVRAFADASSRGQLLHDFYGGSVWRRNAEHCDATIRDIDEAMLLAALEDPPGPPRTPPGNAAGGGAYALEIHPLLRNHQARFAEFFSRNALPAMASLGIHPAAMWITDPSPNTYPRQPVRADPAFVVITRHDSVPELQQFLQRRAADNVWASAVQPGLGALLSAPARLLRLIPTARSPLS